MTTYRTGNHWGVTIVRERKHGGQCAGGLCFEDDFTDECDCWCHDAQPEAQLVAVVVNGDQALAERICALLNAWGDKTDVGARCPKCNMLLAPCWRCGKPSQCGEAWCGDCAPEGGWNAPSAALSQPVSAEQPSGVAESTPDPSKAAQRSWGEHRAHPTCIDVTPIDRLPGSEWVCGPECPRRGEVI